MPLTAEEKAERARERMIEKAREYSTRKYCNGFVRPFFQKMIRAEPASQPDGHVPAVVDGVIREVFRRVGQCVCVTCGKVGPWKGNSIGGGPIESGHFLASSRNSILFEESNVHPQCNTCNDHLSGNRGPYEIWMRHVFGQEEIDRLRRLKTQSVSWDKEQLVDMRIEFTERLRAAEERMKE
jgi:hypothetical protein